MQTDVLPKTDEIFLEDDVLYPEEDGEPMAKSDFQRDSLIYCVDVLKTWFDSDPDAYVSGNLMIYYEKGSPSKSVAPDVFVVFGVPKHNRSSYKTWEEGKGPDLVIEIISKITWRKDMKNIDLYRGMGVREYFMYDPTGNYIDPVLQGYQLGAGGNYQEMRLRKLPGGILKLYSSLLRMELRAESGRLRLFDPGDQEYLFSHTEEKSGRLKERAGRLQAESRADRAEDELRKLKEKLRELGISAD